MSLEDKTPQGLDPLENLYRDRFKEWETTPPDHLWAAIQPKATSRRPLAWLAWQRLKPFVLASALLLSGIAGKYLYDKNTTQLAAGNAESAASGLAQQKAAQAEVQETNAPAAPVTAAAPNTGSGAENSGSTAEQSLTPETSEPGTKQELETSSETLEKPTTGTPTTTPRTSKATAAPVVAGAVIASAHKPSAGKSSTTTAIAETLGKADEGTSTAPEAVADYAPVAKSNLAARSLKRTLASKSAKARRAGIKANRASEEGVDVVAPPLMAQGTQLATNSATTKEANASDVGTESATTAQSQQLAATGTEEKKEVLVPKAEEKTVLKQEPYVAETRGKATAETSGWWLQAYAMPRYTFRNIQASSTSDMQVRRLSSSAGSATRLGYEAGTRVAYKNSGSWEFNAGLHISQLSEELVYEYNRTTPDEVNVRALIDGSLLVTPEFQTHKATQKSRFFYAGLQTGASYYFWKERLRLSGGLGLNWLSQGNTTRVENGVEVAAFSFPSAENPFEQLNMHTYLGLGFNLPVTERFGMVVEPTYTMFLFSTYSQREPLSVVPSTAGLNILLRYKL